MTKQTKGVLITLLAGACFGAASPIAKFVYQYDVTPSCVLAWRFLIASVLLWGYILLFRKDLNYKLRRNQLIMMMVIGGGAHFLTTLCYFSALVYVPISVQIMIFYTYPFLVSIFSVIFFKERMSRQQVIALVAAFVGILMTLTLDDFRVNLIGIVFCFGAAFANTAYMLLLGKKIVVELDSFVISAYASVFAGISCFVYSGFKGELKVNLPVPCWIGIISMALLITIIGAIALSLGVKYIGAAKAAIVSVFEPIEAIVLGAILFHEKITPRGVFGIILVLGAIVLINLSVAEKTDKFVQEEDVQDETMSEIKVE